MFGEDKPWKCTIVNRPKNGKNKKKNNITRN
uniref:Uncharacterized protein n=1 Tax=Rhizophora mucronata TaxID=61149 RepID=A0A2P2QDK9_RHIMU